MSVCSWVPVEVAKHHMKKILKVSFIKTTDTDADLSYLGAYTDKPENWAIVRRDGDYLANLELGFTADEIFNAFQNVKAEDA